MASKTKPVTRTTRTKTPSGVPPPSRTVRATNTRATPTPPPIDSNAKKSVTRKPFNERNASPEGKSRTGTGKTVMKAQDASTKVAANAYVPNDAESEPIRAFLRIRPQIGDEECGISQSNPYLEHVSSTAVRMSDFSSTQPNSRLSSLPQSSVYTFSHVFPADTSQSDFFTQTTLPLVKDVLEGQSGLLFAYGVTNSGKTYTIQGGGEEGSAGILPRTLDVIFNSIEGLHGDARFRPVRLQGIEATLPSLSSSQSSGYSIGLEANGTALADVLLDIPSTNTDTDPTAFKLDRNHEYTIWLSYAEIYNEKVYDLFAAVDDADDVSTTRSQSTGMPHPTSTFLNLPVPSSQSKPLLLTRKALSVKPCPPSDTDDDGVPAGKYVAGLRQLRITSTTQAKALLSLGQMHRQVFGTLANSQSSRSHAMVTIKVLRVHKGERNDPTSIQTSRLTLVDLAGSERTRNTQTTGERLREAGNINKSLMVLGQCMETMRANQRTIARGLNAVVSEEGGRFDTRVAKKSLSIVPFRHSKLTEVLMDYFIGEGRVVMIVNVNPYDTGYDENSHVMKISAIAREVATTASTAVARAVSTIPKSKESLGSSRGSDVAPHRRKVTISTGGPGQSQNETHLEVLEEDEEPGEADDNDDEPINPLVDALFDEIEALRMKLFESEMRSVLIEAQTREEIMTEMEERMQKMEVTYSRRLMQEIEQYELKMDAKIEMLQRSGMLGNGSLPRETQESSEEEELDIIPEGNSNHSESGSDGDGDDSVTSDDRSSSPLGGKNAKHGKASSPLRHSASPSHGDKTDDNALQAIQYRGTLLSSKNAQALPTPPNSQAAEDPSPAPAENATTRARTTTGRRSTRTTRNSSMSDMIQKTRTMTLGEDDGDDDCVVIIPNKKVHSHAITSDPDAVYVPYQGEIDTGRKKKRQLSKKPVVTEADIERAIGVDETQRTSRPIRRSTRGKP
ncbi:P-loop containing nucleoside triphosphate hydrolase protein [Irpex rosettiformis]|uniref:P-loop containing nucleoside triphosphate hydrolase protein n=1 Tax=Irpex rosettiformis TaxID=378272 RepID=A0ACB8ULV6_9APHY|nr:P-loop containing nucleoside triphosphate hydrolase protein [Irpex rosettiformis]